MTDIASISKTGSKSLSFVYGNIESLAKTGSKSLVNSVNGTQPRPPDPGDSGTGIFFRWYNKDLGDGVGVKSLGSIQGNLSAITKVGVKSLSDVIGDLIPVDSITKVGAKAIGTVYAPGSRRTWVKWPRVGTLEYAVDKSNRAGSMPMDWTGDVWNIKKLGNQVISSGTNGVSILNPAGKLFGLNTIHKIGLIGRDAYAGNDFVHYFIDNIGRLYQFDVQLTLLDYREYLALLTDPVLTWDEEEKLLYICDGTLGFVYSPDSQSLGSGPVNVTGIGYQSGIQYAVAPATIATPTFEIWTNTYDFGTRKGKNIIQLDIGTDITEDLFAAIRYRQVKSEDFDQTNWYTVDPRGQAFIPCYGSEFQFGFMSEVYSYFEPDWITIIGDANAY